MSFSLGTFLLVRPATAVLSATLLLVSLSAPAAAAEVHDGSLVGRYADALGTANGRLPAIVRRDLAERLLLLSSYYKLDPCLLGALVTVESAWRARAVSPVGALGYGQLMPGTAASLNVDALEPYENLDGTARYLRRLLNRYVARDLQTRMRLALASYNAGPGAVDRYHGVPPYRETRAYVDNVLRTRAAFVATVDTRATYDIATLLASRRSAAAPSRPSAPAPRRAAIPLPRQLVHAHPRAVTPRMPALALLRPAKDKRPYHRAAFDTSSLAHIALQTPPVRWETSHSVFARMLGLRHRVAPPASVATNVRPQPTVVDTFPMPQ
jgi:transglycosylase-like protein with SLT domain